MNKLGKLDKYINSDLKNFSKDGIRKIISKQDDNLNISLRDGVSISQFSENYDPAEMKYLGSVTFIAEPDILQQINRVLIDSRPSETVNTTTFSRPSSAVLKERLQNLRNQLMGDISVAGNIFNNVAEEQKQKIQNLADKIKGLRENGALPRGVANLLSSQSAAGKNSQIDMKLAGARESLKEDKLNDKINFRYQFSGRPPRVSQNEESPTSQPPQQNVVIKMGKSSLFFETSGKPVIYNDFNFSLYRHYEEIKDILNYIPEEIESENPPLDLRSLENLLRFKVSLEYNFLLRNYEQFLEDNPAVSILNLPYFYEILEFKLLDNPPPELSDYLDGTSFLNKPEKIISLNGERKNLESLIVNSKLSAYKEKADLDKYLNKFNPFKEQFPLYAQIRFSTHSKPQTNLSNLFHEYNLYSKFLSEFKSNLSAINFYNKLQNSSSKFINLNGYLFDQSFIESLFNSNIVTNPALFFKLNSVLANIKRDFRQILSGVSSHTEVIGYVLKKYEKESSTLLQQWFLPNIGEDYLEWIDTQIKLYDKDGNSQQYTYKLDLLVLSIGSIYEYTNPNKPDEEPIEINGNNVTLHFKHQPQFTVFQIENSVQYTNYISDKPPVEPDINIIPFIGVDNKIKFNLNSGIGKFDAIPIFKNDDEQKKINIIYSAQDRIDNKITFESDEPAEIFEIYKLDFKPRNYKDVFEGELITLNTYGATAASYDDNITPNTKYYYVVRCKDYHQNFSNPSKIFEVELINDNGTIYPNIQIVDFEKEEALRQDYKTFRRYLKISPALIQKTVDSSTVTNKDLKLGITTEGVWDKNMKIRLISKQTGRKIDLKFKFKYDISNK